MIYYRVHLCLWGSCEELGTAAALASPAREQTQNVCWQNYLRHAGILRGCTRLSAPALCPIVCYNSAACKLAALFIFISDSWDFLSLLRHAIFVEPVRQKR